MPASAHEEKNTRQRAGHTLARLFRDPAAVELFLNHFPNGVLITDPEGKVIFMNQPYGRFLGIDPKAQIGRHTTRISIIV